MSFNPDAGSTGITKGITELNAGIAPFLGDFEQIVKGHSTLLIILGFVGIIFSFTAGKKRNRLGNFLFIPSALIGAAGLYGYFANKSSSSAKYAHSYYSFPTVYIPSYAQQYIPSQYNTAMTNARNLYSQPLSSYIPNDLDHDVVVPVNNMQKNIQRTVRNVINDSNHVFPHISDVY